MTLPAALPVCLGGWLARIDPRWKLAALVPAGAIVGGLQHLGPTLVGLAGALTLLASARLPWRWCVNRLGAVALLLVLFLGFLPFSRHGDETRWAVGPVSLSPAGVRLACVLLFKAVAMMSLLAAVAVTALPGVYFKALHSLRVPGLLIQIAALTNRFLAVLVDEFTHMRIALRVRGYRQRASPRGLRIAGHVIGMLLVRASARAGRVAQALRCRGFDGHFHALTQFQTRPLDIALFAAVTAVAATLLLWDLLQR